MSTSTVINNILQTNADIGYLLALATGLILGMWAALLGLGWATQKYRSYIIGSEDFTGDGYKEYFAGKKKGLWKNYDEYLND